MAETYQRQTALAHLGLEGRTTEEPGDAGIAMGEVPFPCLVNLRGKPKDKAFMAAAKTALGFALPTVPNSSAGGDGLTAMWLSPEEWWLLAEDESDPEAEGALADRLRKALAKTHHAVTEVGESRTRIRISGPRARDLLAKGCPLDLHPRAFGEPGQCAQTQIAKCAALVRLVAEDEGEGPTFEIFVLRSFADYLWTWLEDAAGEYGMVVTAG